ncbi:CACTA en-spm transposon protein [Cucumis melo var. makuwa]|uniref:CACTA en-spm transposon protein n=1 Tax=Cucumis melo var. makuwa TaxID=1194695 RepID=A0A5D3D8D1_CUCMM|nr:CACTA en-spm transposon protein [Cucumis melo var. makuwa]
MASRIRVDVDLIVVKRPIVRHVINDFIWKRQHFRNLELERYVTQNGKIPISIALGQDMPISPHAVCFNNTINMLTQDTFPICFLTWVDVTPEYIELVKDSLQEQSSMNRAARARQPYNHSSNVKSFLQPQHKLAEQRGHPIDHVELLRETHARGGLFVSHAAANAHNQMLELQSQPTLEGSQSLSIGEICETVLGRRLDYSKELTHIMEVNELLKNRLEVVEEESNRKHEESIRLIKAQTRQMKEMRQMIEDLS